MRAMLDNLLILIPCRFARNEVNRGRSVQPRYSPKPMPPYYDAAADPRNLQDAHGNLRLCESHLHKLRNELLDVLGTIALGYLSKYAGNLLDELLRQLGLDELAAPVEVIK